MAFFSSGLKFGMTDILQFGPQGYGKIRVGFWIV